MGLRYLGNIIKPGYNPLASNITTGVNVVQYQGVFTAQQQLQAQSNGQWAKDPYDYANTLLLQADGIANGSQNNTFLDSSSNNFTITRNGNTTQGTFTPFSQTGWGNYFNGSSYLTAPANTAFAFGTGNLTVEMWLYITAYPGSSAADYFCPATNRPYNAGDSTTWMVIVYGDGTFKFSDSLGTQQVSTTATIPLNRWTHVAVVRSSTSTNGLTIYFNGVAVAQGTNSINFSSTANTLVMGWANDSTAGRYLNGYMSNLRIVKGSAVYTANFNPPTEPLTAITNTQLLTCQSNRFVDNSSNAFAITVNGTPSVQAFSPFAPQFQYTATGTGGSGYFDGTGDYLTLPSSTAAFQMGSGDFTVDCWIYPTASTSPGRIINNWSSATTGAASWELLQAGGGVQFLCSTNGSTSQVSLTGGSISLNSWNHIAGVRSGNVFTLYVNGVSAGTTTQAITLQTADTCTIGARNNLGSYTENFVGYISNARITKGTAIYTGTFTVPTGPFTATMGANPFGGSNTASATAGFLGNFTNAGILDGTMKNNLETVGNASVSTSVVKYGSGSMYFDGTGDYLRAPNSQNIAFGTGDFTIEMWLWFNATPTGDVVVMEARPSSTAVPWIITADATSGGTLYFYDGTTYRSTIPITPQAWMHFAVSRVNGTLRIFNNGVQGFSGTVTTSLNPTGSLIIGARNDGLVPFTGYMDDIRITKGFGRYTQNFIPPSVALPRQ